MHRPNDLKQVNLQDIPLSALEEQLQNVRGRSSHLCDAEYGERADDGALVFHFFPPGYAEDSNRFWVGETWTDFKNRLESAMVARFEHYEAEYVPELRSFCLVVPSPAAIDRAALIEAFFSALES